MNYLITFVAFVVFLFCQYAILICSTAIADWFGFTGRVWYCVVLVAFLILNEFCFGAYDVDLSILENDDEEIEDWNQ